MHTHLAVATLSDMLIPVKALPADLPGLSTVLMKRPTPMLRIIVKMYTHSAYFAIVPALHVRDSGTGQGGRRV